LNLLRKGIFCQIFFFRFFLDAKITTTTLTTTATAKATTTTTTMTAKATAKTTTTKATAYSYYQFQQPSQKTFKPLLTLLFFLTLFFGYIIMLISLLFTINAYFLIFLYLSSSYV